ncbi:MAG: substrate-binding domain-containing protein [Clostridia bacterium]|nr:substrate-binding domain-containing protein [Clostridia bacterium]
MTGKRSKGKIMLTVLAALLLLAGLLASPMVLLIAAFSADYLRVTVPVLYGMAILLLVLLVCGLSRRKWFRYVLMACGAAAVVCGAVIGLGVYDDSIPTVDDRSLMLSEYQPFTGEKTTALPETAALRFSQEQAQSFTIDGATALYPVYAAFVQAVYPEGEYPWHADPDEGLVLCSGTTEAYDRLIRGEADVIFVAEPSVSQQLAAENAGLQLHLTPIGREAFVFFVNSRNPVTGLTLQQVQGIYAGEIVNWREVGGRNQAIRPFQRDEGSGSQTALQKLMMLGGKEILPPEKEEIIGAMDAIIRVTSYKNYSNAIGYTFRFYANEMVMNDQIRLLSLNGVAPTKDTIRDGSYPIASSFYAVTASPVGEPAPQETNPDLAVFLDWCRGPQGQWLVEQVGYVSAQ